MDDSGDFTEKDEHGSNPKGMTNNQVYVILGLGFIVALVFIGIFGSSEDEPVQPPDDQEERMEAILDELIAREERANETAQRNAVRYSVRGATDLVTMSMPDGIVQRDGGGPWVFEAEPGESLTLSVQNSRDSGSVTCRIEVNSQVIAENTSDARYGIASCRGRVPS